MITYSRVFVLVVFLFLLGLQAQAQADGGVKIGVSNYDYANPEFGIITLLNDRNEPDYTISVDDINWGYHFGLWGRLTVWKLFLQLEVLGNSASVDYKIEDLMNGTADKFLKEQYTTLDVPLQLGVELSDWFNIHGGVSGHLPLSQISELRTLEGYEIDPQQFTFSYLGGIGFDFWKLRIDLRYELSTTLFGNTIQYNGNEYNFENNDNRIQVGVGYAF